MKFKILFICVLTIFLIGAVSAENATDAQTADNITVEFDSVQYRDNMTPIEVTVPQNTTGSLKATVDSVEIYCENITNTTTRIPISIPKLPIQSNCMRDSTNHKIYLFYNGLEVKMNHDLKVMNYPQNHGFSFVADEVLKGDDRPYSVVFPISARGNVEIFLDGNLLNSTEVRQFVMVNLSKLSLGNHTLRIKYSGDDYYLASERSYNFTVVDVIVDIPENISLSNSDCVHVESFKKGPVYIYVDGKLLSKGSIGNYNDYYDFLDKVTCGIHEISVSFNGKNYTKRVNVTYGVKFYGDDFRYGGENVVSINDICDDFSANLIEVRVDGKKIKVDYSPNYNFIDVDVSKLGVGNHTISFTYLGDSRYYKYSKSYNFTVGYYFTFPSIFDKKDTLISLNLPADAKGNVEVYVDNKLFKSKKLINGNAIVEFDNILCGLHNVSAKYTGDDYAVYPASMIYMKLPEIRIPDVVYCGEDKFIEVNVAPQSEGYVVFDINGAISNVTVENGSAKLSLKCLKAGYYTLRATYVGPFRVNLTLMESFSISDNVQIIASNNKITYSEVFKYTVKVKINGSAYKNRIVKFKINGKTLTAKTNSKGIANVKISKLGVKKHSIKIICGAKSVKKTITVKHLVSLKVKKSSKRLAIKATLKKVNGKYLKNVKVTFKFAGKSIKVKTNSKGVAKLTVKKPGAKKLTVKATYLKDTVKVKI